MFAVYSIVAVGGDCAVGYFIELEGILLVIQLRCKVCRWLL